MLLKNQDYISPQTGQPVFVVSDSAKRFTESGETVSLYYYDSGTYTADGGQAAGTAVMGQLAYSPVLDGGGTKIGTLNDRSLSFTCDAFTTEKPFRWNVFEANKDASGTNLLAQLTDGYSNGDYCVDYLRGTIYGVKATATASMTAVGYKRLSTASTIEVGDIEIGTVELKNASDDTRAKIGTGSSAAVGDNALIVADPNVKAELETIDASLTTPSSIVGGSKVVATAGTAVTLGDSLTTKSIYIRAKDSNTSDVYVGDSNVDRINSKQIILSANDAVTINIDNRASVYVDAFVNNEGVDYLVIS